MSTRTPRPDWHREGSTCTPTPRRPRRQGLVSLRRGGSALRTKRPRTATARKSDVSDTTNSTNNTTSSEGLRAAAIEIKYCGERTPTIEKCLRWMEALPDKFSGMHLVTQPLVHVDDSS